MRTFRGSAVLLTPAVLALLACMFAPVTPATAADRPVAELLPAAECPAGWLLEDKITLYTKDNLFDRINGEAELYFPYGFETLASGRYANSLTPQIAIEADVYKMGSMLDAFGIFANYRSADDKPAKVGISGTASPTQVLFYRDRYFVRVQASGTTNLDESLLLSCAGMISRNIPPSSGPPRELDAFRLPAVVPDTERYIAQSLLGYAFFKQGIIADAMLDGEKVQVFVVPGESRDAARKSIEEYRAYLAAAGAAMKLTEFPDRQVLTAVDPLYRNVFVEQAGPYIIGTIRLRDGADPKPLIDRLRRMLGPD